MEKMRKAFYYSVDALLAAILIFTAIYIIIDNPPIPETPPSILEDSFLNALSSIKLREIYNYSSAARTAIDSSLVTSPNISLLEAVGELWAINQSSLAREILDRYLSQLNLSVGVYINNEFIAGRNISGDIVLTSRRPISGVAKNKPLEGVSSTASIRKIKDKEFYSYSYLGGFIGQGNISIILELPSWINTSYIDSFEAFLDLGGVFNVTVNNESCISISPTYPLMVPESFDLSSCINSLHNSTNIIRFIPLGEINESFISGGYIRVGYRSDNLIDNPPIENKLHYIPGVEGIINIYDGIPIPGTLNNLSIVLTINNSAETILVIGYDKIILNSTNNETRRIVLTDQNLSSIINYSRISNSTVPIRIYSKEVLPQLVQGGDADIVLITDLSGSMDWRMDSDATGVIRQCDDPLLYDNSTQRLSLAKCLDKKFVDMILNYTGNRISLVGFNTGIRSTSLTDDKDALMHEIEQYSPNGGTCICCAINTAYNILASQSNSSRKRYIVVMSDGIPTHQCARWSCTGTSTSAYWLWWSGCYGNSADCVGDDCSCPMYNANWSSCRAHNDLNATIYSIGFGPVDSCENANTTLRSIAECGNGSYYSSSDPYVLDQIYTDIAEEIINMSYKEQVVYVEGSFVPARLYNDSYINISIIQEQVELPASSIDLIYEEKINDCNVSINIPGGITVIDASLTSFSGPHWTKRVIVNNHTLLNLTEYRFSYIELGDPFLIAVPPDILLANSSNNISMIAGDSEINDSECMKNNSLILHIAVPSTTTRTIPLPELEGCNWEIEVYNKGLEHITIPEGYDGDRNCSYTSMNISFNDNNAYDVAVYELLSALDPDRDGEILASFEEGDIEIIVTSISGVPYMWGPAMIEVRRVLE